MNILSLHKTITLVDARKLSQTRYTTDETFNQQIRVAEIDNTLLQPEKKTQVCTKRLYHAL